MALHKDFPQSPHAVLDPSIRWFPADEAVKGDLRNLPLFVYDTFFCYLCQEVNNGKIICGS